MTARKQSSREAAFALAWAISGNGVAYREQFYFDITRQWRFDFAWPSANGVQVRVAIELQGGEFRHGGHNRGRGMQKDYEKWRAAVLQGWLILPFVGVDLDERPVQCCEQIIKAMRLRGWK